MRIICKNKDSGVFGWFSESFNERIKIDLSLVHHFEKMIFL